jgi:type I restriction enzyme S subunit
VSAILNKLLKEQNVEWHTIEQIFHLRNGYTPSKSNEAYWTNGTIPWFRMEDIRENGNILDSALQQISESAVKGNKLFPKNSFIIATSATIGEHALITVPYLANQRFTNLSLKDDFINRFNIYFLYYYLFKLDEWCRNNTTMSSFASVDMNGFRKFEIPIPPLDVQDEIVRILDAFTAVTAELTAELNMREKQYQYYHDKLLDFSHRDIEWTTLDKVSLVIDSLHQTPKYSENGLNMIRVTDIKSGLIDLSKTLKVDQETFKIFTKKYLPKKFDLVISRVGSYGNVAVVPEDNVVCMGQNTVVINPLINSIFLYHILTSKNTKLFIEKNVGGGNQKTLSLKSIKEIPIPSIDFKEQGYIANILSKFETLTHSITQGLPKEIALREQQYEYYREQLLDFAKN